MTDASLDRDTLKALSAKTPWPWLRDALLDWGVIACAAGAAVWADHWAMWAAAALVVGNRQHALAILGHDGTHYTLLRSKLWNDVLTNALAFWPLGLTADGYRELHFQHHRYANTERDPELLHRAGKAPQWDLPTRPITVLGYAALDLVGYSVPDYLLIVRFARPQHLSSFSALVAFHAGMIAGCTVTAAWPLAGLWYGALLTTFMMQFRLRTWLEHQGSDGTHRLHLGWTARILLSPHNAWYHYEHHHCPSVPYHRLPQLRALLPGEPVLTLRQLMSTYARSGVIASGMPLKALDTQP
jgi:fatty acid desaturase